MINNGTNKQFLESSVNCHIFLPFWVDLRASDGDRDISLRFRYGHLPQVNRMCSESGHMQFICRRQWRIQDFPRGGREPSRGGVNTPNFPENCMKSKEFGRPGGGVRPSRPPRSANGRCPYMNLSKISLSLSEAKSTNHPFWLQKSHNFHQSISCTFT